MAKNAWIIILVIVAVIVGMQYFTNKAPVTPSGDGANQAQDCQYSPTVQFSAKDKFGTTTVSGSKYYKQDGLQYTSTEITALNKNVAYSYWVDNNTYYVKPATITADCGNNILVAEAFNNASVTLAGRDTVTLNSITTGANNISMGANAIANVQITYQGTAKKSAAPFGGVLVVEYNSSIASVTCSGADISATTPYHVTYSVAATTATSAKFGFGPSLDDGSGTPKTINCQFQNGASAAGAGAAYYFKFIPANYYFTNAGNVVLDTEKFENQDTTRTNLKNTPTLTAWWS